MESQDKVEFFKHNIGPDEVASCLQTLASLFHTTGPACARFEEEFAQLLGVKHVVSVSSCTTGLELALKALGIGPGDEVITTPLTFIATPNAALYVGAKPVFVDAEPVSGNIDPDLIAGGLTSRTKAIIPVHMYGNMCDMTAIKALADRHGLKVVNDCAHTVEGRRDGVGSAGLADLACYSFYTTKNLSCGEGGAVATDDDLLAEKLRRLRLHGMSKGASDRYHDLYQHWDMVELGAKGNLSDILASLLLPQLPKLAGYLARREAIASRYEEAFAGLPGVDFPRVPAGSISARHLFTIWVAQRDRFLHELQRRGIGVAVNYRAVHLLTYYRETFGFKPGDFPVAERIGDATLSLPLYPKLEDDEVARVIAAVSEVAHLLA
ncbi:MAG: DegT/DnrJ/EryC1/StrS family aminotransferase [Thermodesulfobacteriota bacterium]